MRGVNQRYYVQPSAQGFQVRDNETQRIVEENGSMLMFKNRTEAGKVCRRLNEKEA